MTNLNWKPKIPMPPSLRLAYQKVFFVWTILFSYRSSCCPMKKRIWNDCLNFSFLEIWPIGRLKIYARYNAMTIKALQNETSNMFSVLLRRLFSVWSVLKICHSLGWHFSIFHFWTKWSFQKSLATFWFDGYSVEVAWELLLISETYPFWHKCL